MERTVSASNSKLQDYDELATDSGNIRVYTTYMRKYLLLTSTLRESEERLDFLIRGRDRFDNIKAERDHYERVIRQLETVKSEYDSWLRTVQ